ncbi:hypothetical protein ABC255_02535 [Neobacillus sp. 3P2-tot-E-2]|uniref:hypothetical protein n=1 Tax=Neobacillus sp. 3P2-tot-E-2 TaxID=3132212 RepID=UPI0039A0E03A
MVSIKEKLIYYVALGDSLAEGTTPFGEKGKGYPAYLTDKLKNSGAIQFNNFGVPGFTSENLKRELLEN